MRTQKPEQTYRLYWLIALATASMGSGCAQPHMPTESAALRARLGTIETLQLKDLSEAEPVTIEQATQTIAEEVDEPNESLASVTLTLEQIRAAALANNLDLKVEQVDPSIAHTAVDEERARFEAAFYADAGYRRVEGVGTDKVTSTRSYEVGVSKPLATGGSIVVGLPFGDTDDGTDGVAEAGASVRYVQSLLRGAGTRVNTQPIRIAGLQSRIIDARTKQAAINVLAQADITYWRLYGARKELDVRTEQYKLAKDQLSHARKKVASGSAPQIEIVRAEAGLSSRLEAVINAETAVQANQRDLLRIMNRPDLPMDTRLAVIPQTEPNPQGLDLDGRRLVEQALASRMDLFQLEQRLAIDDLRVETSRNAALPDLTLTAGYGAYRRGDTWQDSYSRLMDRSHDDVSVGLGLQIPFGNKAAEARLRRAELERLQTRAMNRQAQQEIRQDVLDAVSELKRNWRRILAAQQSAEAAYRDYRVEQSQFQLGVRTSTDVLFAATRMADAQISRIYAFAGYEIAQINLARATGTLLGYGRVRLEPQGKDEG